MCLNPILRPNPNRGHYRSGLNFTKDCDNQYIYVPCGHCPDCVSMRQAQLVQRADAESRSNHMFFCTLTYDNKHIPKLQVEVPVVPEEAGQPDTKGLIPVEVVASSLSERIDCGISPEEVEQLLEDSGFDVDLDDITERPSPLDPDLSPVQEYRTVDIMYADIHHVQLMMKNLRDNLLSTELFSGRKISYIAVSERGKQNGRPHFHILFFITKLPGDFQTQQLHGLTFKGSGRITYGCVRALEKALWSAVFKYWSINVGTRKQPVYEPLFTYKKRYSGSKVYTNFDLHYVDPGLSTDGTNNVVYYVSKYMMKGSEKEDKLQQFLALNFSASQFDEIWKIVKSRMLISKGLGLNVVFETLEEQIPLKSYFPVWNYMDSDDLPPDYVYGGSETVYRTVKKRIMIPDFELAQKLRNELIRDCGKEPGPIYITTQGKHVPLCRYYQKFGWLFTTTDFLSLWFNDPDPDRPKAWENQDARIKKEIAHKKKLRVIESNSTFDTNPVLLSLQDDSNPVSYV